MRPPRIVAALIATGTVAIFAPGSPALAQAGEPAPPRTVVVEFDPSSSDAERSADLRAQGLELVEVTDGADFGLAVSNAAPSDGPDAIGAIEDIDPVVSYRAFGIPNDPAFGAQWHLDAIQAAEAWDISDGSGTVVAVIDTGVAYLDRGQFLRAPDMAGTSFAPGWDFVDGDAYPHDENGHGTHVASTIAATTGNGVGVAGAAPGATIMPLRVLGADGSGTDWHTAQALRFAVDNGADVANLSLGSPVPSSVMADAVAYAASRGVTVVAASGNDGATNVSYPAAFESVIAVGAVRQDLTRPAYSNRGAALDLVAPGGDTKVDQDGDGYKDGILQESFVDSPNDFCYCFFQGTSMAAPQVSAVASMLVARGVTDPGAIELLLTATAQDLGPPGRDDQFGFGLVQARAAVSAPLPLPQPPDVPIVDEPPVAEPGAGEPGAGEPGSEAPVPTTSVRGIDNACPSSTTPAPSFTDIGGSVHERAIGCVAWWEVASGRTPDTFDPRGSMTRAQLASFVARMLEASDVALPSAPPDAFTDDEGSTHEARINQLAALGVVRGRTATTYAPGSIVTRAEMATFLVRAHDLVADEPLPVGPDRFADDDGSTHEDNIDKVAAAGLAAGTSPTTFGPGDPVARGQMATFLARTLDLFVDSRVVAPR